MKVRTVSLLSLVGMICTSATVYSLTPAPRRAADLSATPDTPPAGGEVAEEAPASSFEAGTTLRVSGRVGHARVVRGASGETFVLLEVGTGEEVAAAPQGRGHLAIVIDRSGSMTGIRINNAIAGAVDAVNRLGDDDMVSVVTFDSAARTVVPMTTLRGENRARVTAEIRRITPGGDTCISCGIEEGMRELSRSANRVDRMILLSDGDATTGVRDMPGFRAIAERARAQGVNVSTVGVGVEYNQKILGGIALEGGGDHYFIENAASLGRVFQAEVEKLRGTLARDVRVSIEPGEGVEIEQVFDRAFERRGRGVIVPLESFSRGEQKTVLLQVRVPTQARGRVAVAGVSVDYTDLVRAERERTAGQLEVSVGAAASGLDAVVLGRIERTKTANALLEANALVERGKVAEARRRIADREHELAAAAATAVAAAPTARARDVDRDFSGQASSLSTADAALAAPSPSASQRALRSNQERANPLFR